MTIWTNLSRALAVVALLCAASLSPVFAQGAQPDGSVALSDLMKTAEGVEERALGAANAPVVIVEYASLTCPHCASFHAGTLPVLKRDFVDAGKVRFVFRDFPFDGLALAGAMIARCAPAESYFTVLDTLFTEQEGWAFSKDPESALKAIAARYGFTQESFDACLQNQKIYDGVLGERQRAYETLGVKSTPTLFVNGVRYKGALTPADLAEAIANAAARPQ